MFLTAPPPNIAVEGQSHPSRAILLRPAVQSLTSDSGLRDALSTILGGDHVKGFAAILLLSSAPSMAIGQDNLSHRLIPLSVESSSSIGDLRECIARQLHGAPVINDKRTIIDQPVDATHSYFSVVIDGVEGTKSITAIYRHPINQSFATKLLRRVAIKCFPSDFNEAVKMHPEMKLKPIA